MPNVRAPDEQRVQRLDQWDDDPVPRPRAHQQEDWGNQTSADMAAAIQASMNDMGGVNSAQMTEEEMIARAIEESQKYM
jgi:hypothetical protein